MYSVPGFRTVYHSQGEVLPVNLSPTKPTAYEDFVENTSLLGIQQILRKKSLIWLLAYIICVAMSIVQSWSVTITYFEKKTYHSVRVISNNSMQFPSVSVCTNTVLRDGFNYSRIPGFNVSVHMELLKIKDCSKKNNLMQLWSRSVRKNNKAVVQYLRRLSSKERTSLGLNLMKYIKRCRFKGRPCNFSNPDEFNFFNNPYYGNCFTFNPAFEEKSARFVGLEDKLRMDFHLESKGYWLVSRIKPKAAVHIHPPGTAPLLESPEVEDVFGGQSAVLYVTLSERAAIKKQGESIPSCIDNLDAEYRKRSRYYTVQTPYRYSLEACMKSCEQDYVGKSCGAISKYLPTQSSKYEATHNVSLNLLCHFKESFSMESCKCPIACRDLQYRIAKDENELSNMACQEETETMQTSALHKNHHNQRDEEDSTDYKHQAEVTVLLRSNVYEHIDELLSCKLSEYLGILGGNMSLWIGLCIISLLELVELGIKLIATAMRSPNKTLRYNAAQSMIENQKEFIITRRRFSPVIDLK